MQNKTHHADQLALHKNIGNAPSMVNESKIEPYVTANKG